MIASDSISKCVVAMLAISNIVSSSSTGNSVVVVVAVVTLAAMCASSLGGSTQCQHALQCIVYYTHYRYYKQHYSH
jgi:hypothetical protein